MAPYLRMQLPGSIHLSSFWLTVLPGRTAPHLLAVSDDYLHCWETSTGELAWKVPAPEGDLCWAEGRQALGRDAIVGLSREGIIRLDAKSGRTIFDARREQGIADPLWAGDIGRRPDGRDIVVAGGADCLIYRWDLSNGRQIEPVLDGHDENISWLRIMELPGRSIIFSVSDDRSIVKWDATTGERLEVIIPAFAEEAMPLTVEMAAISSQDFVWVVSDDLARIHRWDSAYASQPTANPIHAGEFFQYAFRMKLTSIEGRLRLIAMGQGEPIQSWDLATGEYQGPGTWIDKIQNFSMVEMPSGEALAAVYTGGDFEVEISPISYVLNRRPGIEFETIVLE